MTVNRLFFILAAIAFVLAIFGVSPAGLNAIALGLFFMALGHAA